MPDNGDLHRAYRDRLPLFEQLGDSIVGAIKAFLRQQQIPFVDIASRVKTLASAEEKFFRKGYLDPINDIEDWCGVRVVCYYASDIDRICKILRAEFDVATEENTAQRLELQEFGYRSTHFILSIKKSWLEAPQYRGLEGIQAEVQVRTILMHAWAEIEHKLAYKSFEQIPDLFKRRLYRLSAKFEEADEQFEELRRDLLTYRETVRASTKKNLSAFRAEPLDLDTFQVFLDAAYPDKEPSKERTARLLTEIQELGLEMKDLVEAAEAQASILRELEGISPGSNWAQVGAMRNALDISNEHYYASRYETLSRHTGQPWFQLVRFGRKKLGRSETPNPSAERTHLSKRSRASSVKR